MTKININTEQVLNWIDRFPGVGTVSNGLTLIAKGVLSLTATKETVDKSRLYTYIRNKSLARTIAGIFPFVLLIYDLYQSWQKKKRDQAHQDSQKGFELMQLGRHGEAIPYLVKAAEAGEHAAMYNLSTCYLFTLGVPKDVKKGIYWLEQSAKAGNANANWYLGSAYLEPEFLDFEQDPHRALKYFERAAELDPQRAWDLGKAYLQEISNGTLEDGFKWLENAYRRDPKFGFELGREYQVHQKFKQAHEIYCEVVKRDPENPNNADVYFHLGQLHGEGLVKDASKDRAREYYQKAFALGFSAAERRIHKLDSDEPLSPGTSYVVPTHEDMPVKEKNVFVALKALAQATPRNMDFSGGSIQIESAAEVPAIKRGSDARREKGFF